MKCVAGGKLCLGMAPEAALGVDDDIGGALGIKCGPAVGASAGRDLNALELMRVDCPAANYVISFSNGRRLTNVWVDQGKIVRLDNYPRHSFDP